MPFKVRKVHSPYLSLPVRQAGGRQGQCPAVHSIILFLLIIDCCLLTAAFASEPPRYEIEAKLDTLNHKIKASQKVVFTNNSEQELKEICFRIYPHRKYTPAEIRFIYRFAGYFKINPFPQGFESGDLKINSIASGGQMLTYAIEGEDQTILRINLDTALKPGESREINLDFEVTIPHAYGRFGWHKDIISLVRWYPILSVFDQEGWHNYPSYLYHLPYFSDASYYKVKLTLAGGQKVASTGYLKDEVVNPDSTKTLNIETDFPVRDFSLGISKNFQVYSLTEGKTRVNSYYLKGDGKKAEAAARYASALMKFYSQRFGEYPYQEFNIVPSYLGYGGVQTSNQVFIDTRVYKLPEFLSRYFDFLISHETGHQWFYNIIGCDEYRQIFLDEGLNSYWLLQYLEDKYGRNALVVDLPKFLSWFIPNFSFRESGIARYLYLARCGFDHPIIGELASFQEPSSIFAITYGKGSGVLSMLEGLIGKDKFLKFMQRYTNEFRFKNIMLDDFIRICNEETGQDLTWFFQEWLKTEESCDYAVKSLTQDKIILENKGEINMPIETRIIYKDGSEKIDSWDGKGKSRIIPIDNKDKIKQIQLDPDNLITLDLDRTNNYWPRNLCVKPVPVYFGVYEVPVFSPRDSYNLILGPSLGGSSLGLAGSLQRPYDNVLRVASEYDFNEKEIKSTLGYEIQHIFNQQMDLGLEVFDYESSKDNQDLWGGKIYLRRQLWPADYGLFATNDHVTFYLIRDQKLESSSAFGSQEDIRNLYYRRKDEAIVGVTGSLGSYGPYPDPDYGFRFSPTLESAGHFLGGKESFWRTTAELVNYQLLIPKHQHKLATRIKAGWGGSLDKKLFQLGGHDALRGYSRKTIEGSRMILGSLEYRFPLKSDIRLYLADNIIGLDKIQGVVFFDVGKSWYGDFSGRHFKKDAGIGFRAHFDIIGFLEKIVLRIDIAQAINEPKEEPHVWLGISHAF